MRSADTVTELGLLEREPFEAALEEWLDEVRAGRFHDDALRIASLNDIGTIEFLAGRAEGRDKLEHSLELALREGLDEDVARAYLNLAWAATRVRELDLAERYLRDGIE